MKRRSPMVIVIDDDPIMQRLITNLLTREGYQVQAVNSVSRALDLIAKQPPDVVLCDLVLPLTSGLDFLRHCQETPALRHLPVVIVSATSEEAKIAEALALGAVAHLPKPFSQAQLSSIVSRALSAKPKP